MLAMMCKPYSLTEERFTNLARSRMSSWSGVFCVAGKEVMSMQKSPIRLLICEQSADTHVLKDHSQTGY